MNSVKIWRGEAPSRVLAIGHVPRLVSSKTEAEVCFFADYYFMEKPTQKIELGTLALAVNRFV